MEKNWKRIKEKQRGNGIIWSEIRYIDRENIKYREREKERERERSVRNLECLQIRLILQEKFYLEIWKNYLSNKWIKMKMNI
jgi:hypothetical protein